MLAPRRTLFLTVASALAGLAGLALAAPAASAESMTGTRPVYAAPSGAWTRFTSDLSGAQGLATGQGVTVALLSTGADTSVPGLSGKVTEGPDYIYKPRGSLVHDVGTLTASLIVGSPGAATGIAPDSKILAVRITPDGNEPGAAGFFDAQDYDDTQQPIEAKAIRYAVDHGAQVIQISSETWGGAGVHAELWSAISYALRKNVVIVAPEATSGKSSGGYLYPAGLPGVIGVASVMLPGGEPPVAGTGAVASGNASADNNSVAITGPGDFVQAASSGWGLYGTATAAAYVTGTVALIRQRYPHLPPTLVEQALAMSARYHPAGGYSKAAGFGVLDPYDAILDAGKVARNTVTAAPGQGTVTAAGRFGAGPRPEVIDALPSAQAQTIASWAAIGVGAALLVLAVILLLRRRRREPRVPAPGGGPWPGPGPGEPGQPWPGQQGQPWPVQQGPHWPGQQDQQGQPWPGQQGQPWPDQQGRQWPGQQGQPWPGQQGQPWPDQQGRQWPGQQGQPGPAQPWPGQQGPSGQPWPGRQGPPWPEQPGPPAWPAQPLQELAQPEEVLHAGLDLHPSGDPCPRDVHR
jgi:membrane-anchored mycosin MYCP